MPIITEFEYYKPKTMDEALGALHRYQGKAKILAGGTDLIVHLKENYVHPELVVDIKGLTELKTLTATKDVLTIGALITFAEIIDSPLIKKHCPVLREAAATVASTGVRNRATLAGNICSAVPSADSAPILAVYDAQVLVKNQKGGRRISIHEFFAGPKKTILTPDELVVAVELQLPMHKAGVSYYKLSRYEGEDLAQGGLAAMALSDKTYRLAHCALGPKPARAFKTEILLNGAKLDDQVLEKAKHMLLSEISPISDIRSSKEYRIHMAQIMLERTLKGAVEKLFKK